jgi:hypothetical protein
VIYVATIRAPFFTATKVGIAKNPADRMQTLQTANPFAVELCAVAAFVVSSRRGKYKVTCEGDVESAVHAQLAATGAYSAGGTEWFMCDPETAIVALDHRALAIARNPVRAHGICPEVSEVRFRRWWRDWSQAPSTPWTYGFFAPRHFGPAANSNLTQGQRRAALYCDDKIRGAAYYADR